MGEGEVGDVERGVVDERREVHGPSDAGEAIGGVRRVKRGVREAAAGGGEVVAFASGDLGIEGLEQVCGEVGAASAVEGDFVGIEQPIEVAPDFGTEDAGRTFVGGEGAHGFERAQEHGDVRVVFVGGVVHVNDLR